MKQSRVHLPLLVLLIISIAIILWKSPRSARMAAIDSEPKAAPLPIEPMEQTESAPAPSPQHEPMQTAPAPAEAEEPQTEVEIIAAVLENINPMKVSDMRRAIGTLRTFPPEQVSA